MYQVILTNNVNVLNKSLPDRTLSKNKDNGKLCIAAYFERYAESLEFEHPEQAFNAFKDYTKSQYEQQGPDSNDDDIFSPENYIFAEDADDNYIICKKYDFRYHVTGYKIVYKGGAE